MKKNVGTSYFKDLSRKDYVVQASRIIKKEGVEAISIRRIAAELGCSSASMYRYFQNLDELLFYAQLDALNEYILDLSKCEKDWNDIWDVHFGIWRSYAKEAFKKPQAFEAVFYRNINRDLGEALKEYYEMFPDAIIEGLLIQSKKIISSSRRCLRYPAITRGIIIYAGFWWLRAKFQRKMQKS